MIGEKIAIEKKYFLLSTEIISYLENEELFSKNKKIVISICGESGSGKSTTAVCLKKKLEERGVLSQILHQDNFYRLPPTDNHLNRKKSLDNIGIHEVDTDNIQEQIDNFLKGITKTTIPRVLYEQNKFVEQDLNLENVQVLIIEGTYVFNLKQLDLKIFLSKDYSHTMEERKNRTREKYDPFVEEVLEIEHNIIQRLGKDADITIDSNFNVVNS